MSNQIRRAWYMLARGDEVESVQIATGLDKFFLELMLKDIRRRPLGEENVSGLRKPSGARKTKA